MAFENQGEPDGMVYNTRQVQEAFYLRVLSTPSSRSLVPSRKTHFIMPPSAVCIQAWKTRRLAAFDSMYLEGAAAMALNRVKALAFEVL